jgi:hypothetical protein
MGGLSICCLARGLFAIESKDHNATVHCDGDRWWSTKTDEYGNPVGGGGAIADAFIPDGVFVVNLGQAHPSVPG